jgi:hypothetical protein
MNDDDLANLLGEAPATPDPVFRYGVFARVATQARHRAARHRALNIMAASTAAGLFCALAQAGGFTLQAAQPLLYGAAVAALTCILAEEARKSSHSVLARTLGRLRFRL